MNFFWILMRKLRGRNYSQEGKDCLSKCSAILQEFSDIRKEAKEKEDQITNIFHEMDNSTAVIQFRAVLRARRLKLDSESGSLWLRQSYSNVKKTTDWTGTTVRQAQMLAADLKKHLDTVKTRLEDQSIYLDRLLKMLSGINKENSPLYQGEKATVVQLSIQDIEMAEMMYNRFNNAHAIRRKRTIRLRRDLGKREETLNRLYKVSETLGFGICTPDNYSEIIKGLHACKAEKNPVFFDVVEKHRMLDGVIERAGSDSLQNIRRASGFRASP